MEKNLSGKNGISIRLLTEKLKKEMTKNTSPIEKKRKTKNSFSKGKLTTSDWKNISIGLKLLDRIAHEGFSTQEEQLLDGKSDISKLKKEILCYRNIMEDFIMRLSKGARDEYELQKRMELLPDYSQIAQAARDGIIVKQERKIYLSLQLMNKIIWKNY